ncbi:MAG: PLP-dependent aminotransferase family protein [Gemmatimonadota bacterium]|nr:PLP-dependent aminotransferase family protein [Gemmatimonadota bacterium]
MPRHPRAATPLVVVDNSLDAPLWRQIYDQLRDAIVSGRLATGTKLPASRVLGKDLVVSRNSVNAAYEQLRAEGYLEQRQRLGSFVASVIPDVAARPQSRPVDVPEARAAAQLQKPPQAQQPPQRHANLSSTGAVFVRAAERLSQSRQLSDWATPLAFRIGDPATDAFPLALWSRLVARRWRTGQVPLGYSDPAGAIELRRAIAEYLNTSRGVRCEPEQVFIASGTQQALDLAMRLVLSPGDPVWVENPGYPGARSAVEGAGATVVPVSVDDEGLSVEHGIRLCPNARGVYVTPSHQFPLGAVMSVTRRLALLRWAAEADAWIFEDDYDSEFRYASRPLPSLQGLDEHGRVIYTGTFSKTLFPALRLAYVVSPPSLVDAFQAACILGGRYAPTDGQLVVTDFINEGHFERHLRRMRALYASRQHALLDCVRDFLADSLDVAPSAAGLHLVAWLKDPQFDARQVSARAADAGVEIPPLANYTFTPMDRDGFLMGYGAYEPNVMRTAALRLATVLRKMAAR